MERREEEAGRGGKGGEGRGDNEDLVGKREEGGKGGRSQGRRTISEKRGERLKER